jgi:polyether ionophore transport system ATP-binding protein
MDIAIQTKGLTKSYGSFVALAPLDLEVKKGEVLGYLGPNGAGKTTTIRLMLGLIQPTGGSCQIFGIDALTDKVKAHQRVAYIPGEPTFWPNLTGAETLHFLGELHGVYDKKYLTELIKRFDFEPNKKVRTYSKGNRQKISLIAAFMTRADLLMMDEPTSGLDPIMEQAFRQSVMEAKSVGQTVFLSSHILEEVEALCDRVAILRTGHLVELGTLEKMRHLSALTVEATFTGTPPKLKDIPGVQDVKISAHSLRCRVNGPIAPLLKHLASSDITKLTSREPSLEELFLSLYGDVEVTKQGAHSER